MTEPERTIPGIQELAAHPAVNRAGQKNPEERDIDRECAEFQALMSERIGAGEDLQCYEHMRTCDRCSALVRDLEYIAEVASQLIPQEVEPPEEVWTNIRLAIEHGEA